MQLLRESCLWGKPLKLLGRQEDRMKKFLVAMVFAVVVMAAFPVSATDAAGGGNYVFDETIRVTVAEPIVVSSCGISETQIEPGGKTKITYKIRNLSSQKHYYVFCDIIFPPGCLVEAKWLDTREDYTLGTEFLVPLLGYRELEITLSTDTHMEEDKFDIIIQFFRTYGLEGLG